MWSLLKKAPQNLSIRVSFAVCANTAPLRWVQYVFSNFSKDADQKFFAELFFLVTSRPQTKNSKNN